MNAIRHMLARLRDSIVADDPVAQSLSGQDILFRYGGQAYRAWREASCPIVTPDDFTVLAPATR